MHAREISLSHGSGGLLSYQLIREKIVKVLGNSILGKLGDSAVIKTAKFSAFTTDSFVVNPINFPNGDIGKLAVCGTVNDLVVQGARPEYLSLAFIIEEGFSFKEFDLILTSIKKTAKKLKVKIVTGDFKVVEKGACDKIFINTSGVGSIVRHLGAERIKPKDKIIITGEIASHGMSVLCARNNLSFLIKSDCQGLNNLLIPVLKRFPEIKFMRDPTRGGLASTLNEISLLVKRSVNINQKDIPISKKVVAASEILGIDPLFLANEGAALIIVSPKKAESLLGALRKHKIAKKSRIIGEISSSFEKTVVLKTISGTKRILEMPIAEPLPRIC